jgi:hypothetical protein
MDEIFAAAAHEAAHGVRALDSPDIRVKSLELFPHAHGCGGLMRRLTRRGTFDPTTEVLIRLAGPAAETVFYNARWDGSCVDFRETRSLVDQHFPGQMLEFWREAQAAIFPKEPLIRRVADVLAKPPYRLLEAKFMAPLVAFVALENRENLTCMLVSNAVFARLRPRFRTQS